VFCGVQVPGLAPPGVVIPQLGRASRIGAPGVVIPQLGSASRLGAPGVVIPQLSTASSCLSLFSSLSFSKSYHLMIFLIGLVGGWLMV